MTELSGNEVREVQWASSDEGKAQLRAAWERAMQLGLTSRPARFLSTDYLSMSDVGAMLWAAREARVPDDPEVTVRRTARHQLLQLIKDSGEDGITVRELCRQLGCRRETVHSWLRELAALTLITSFKRGSEPRWKMARDEPAAGIATVLSGCAYCHRIIVQAAGSGLPWRTVPDRAAEPWQVFRNEDAVRCASSPDDRHHPPAPDSSGRLLDEPGRSALAHLREM